MRKSIKIIIVSAFAGTAEDDVYTNQEVKMISKFPLIMRRYNFLLAMGILLLSISCSKSVEIAHQGERKVKRMVAMLDSVIIDADSTSGRGNFFMQDSFIYFADSYYMTIFQYDFASASCRKCYFGKGQGPDELSSFIYAYPFKGKNGECFMMDSSLGMYTYRNGQYSLAYKGRLDFDWGHVSKNDYESPSVYNLMEMTDFGIDLTYINDSLILCPVSLVNRNLEEISKERYEKGHIFAELNTGNMKVERVFGHFPEVYQKKPTPFFEFFQYAMYSDTLYVNHAVDSLIYVYKYPDTLLYTIGYEALGVNRNYTIGYNMEMSDFKSDIEVVGANSGLLYIPESRLLLRTALKDFKSRQVNMQAYLDNDLVLETDMPAFFKLLSFWDGDFYGVKMLPEEDESGKIHFVFYRFKIVNI